VKACQVKVVSVPNSTPRVGFQRFPVYFTSNQPREKKYMSVRNKRTPVIDAHPASRSGNWKRMQAGLTVAACVLITAPALQAQEFLARDLLVQMSRNQSGMLCSIKAFTDCMEFSEQQCVELSEQAIKQCLLPLPEKINMAELQNDSIEACPKQVYEDAGYTDEKAKACLVEANEKK
jgi:hypothetical protein